MLHATPSLPQNLSLDLLKQAMFWHLSLAVLGIAINRHICEETRKTRVIVKARKIRSDKWRLQVHPDALVATRRNIKILSTPKAIYQA
ncbi:hypothetical protein AND_002116 [Anopheles darlingi]|uniref:Uncharacterized protein n=1 Tax=Anopheles darlingi TaxID=43151 RepID=W5JTM8_ANODA|nr:hypothetical protein AND_002116 [Anopheles darlingi]